MRQDQWSNTLTIDGVPLGVWDTLSGGEVEAEDTKHRPGGMGAQVSLGGPSMTNNITMTRLLGQSDWDFMRYLMQSRVGRAECVVSRQPLDRDKNPFGRPLVYRGVLQRCAPGDTDSNSADSQMWEVVVSTEGDIG